MAFITIVVFKTSRKELNMWALILACSSFHTKPITNLNGFSNEYSCQVAGNNALKQFSGNGNIYEFGCKFICVNQNLKPTITK